MIGGVTKDLLVRKVVHVFLIPNDVGLASRRLGLHGLVPLPKRAVQRNVGLSLAVVAVTRLVLVAGVARLVLKRRMALVRLRMGSVVAKAFLIVSVVLVFVSILVLRMVVVLHARVQRVLIR